MSRRWLLVVFLLAACRREPPTSMLLIAGSSTMQGYLAPVTAALAKKDPEINIVNESGGAAAGIIALKRGAIDVATLTRDLKRDEDDAQIRDYLVARDGIAIIVNPANPVSNLTMAQLRGIYTQQIVSWKAVGGPDVKIEIVTRPENAKVQKSLRDLILKGDAMPPGHEVESLKDMIALVKTAPGAIGFLSLRALNKDVKTLTINGVEMSRLTILSDRYPLSRSFFLVLYGLSSPAAEELVSFALSDAGQAIFAEDGLIPVH